MTRRSRFQYQYQAPFHPQTVPRDVAYINCRGIKFRVALPVIGLFPESVLCQMFRDGMIPFHSIVNGKETPYSVYATKQVALMYLQWRMDEILKMKQTGGTPNETTPSVLQQNGAEEPYYSNDDFDDHSFDHPDFASPADIHRPSNHKPFYNPLEYSHLYDRNDVDHWKFVECDFDPEQFVFFMGKFKEQLQRNEEVLMKPTPEIVPATNGVANDSEGADGWRATGKLLESPDHVSPTPDNVAANGVISEGTAESGPKNGERSRAESEEPAPSPDDGGRFGKRRKKSSAAKGSSKRSSSASIPPDSPLSSRPSKSSLRDLTVPTSLLRRISSGLVSIKQLLAGSPRHDRASNIDPALDNLDMRRRSLTPAPGDGWVGDIVILREELDFYPVISTEVELGDGETDEVKKSWKGRWRRRFSTKGKESEKDLGDGGMESLESVISAAAAERRWIAKTIKKECGERLRDHRIVVKPYAERGVDLFNVTEAIRQGLSVPSVVSKGTGSGTATAASSTSNIPSASEPQAQQQLQPQSQQPTTQQQQQEQSILIIRPTSPYSLLNPPKVSRPLMVNELPEQLMHTHLLQALQTLTPDLTSDRTWDFRKVDDRLPKVSSVVMLPTRPWEEVTSLVQEEGKKVEEDEEERRRKAREPVIEIIEEGVGEEKEKEGIKGKGRLSWLKWGSRKSLEEKKVGGGKEDGGLAVPEAGSREGEDKDVGGGEQSALEPSQEEQPEKFVVLDMEEPTLEPARAQTPTPKPETPHQAASPPANSSSSSPPTSLITQVHDPSEDTTTTAPPPPAPSQTNDHIDSTAQSMLHLLNHLVGKRPVRKCWWECYKITVDIPLYPEQVESAATTPAAAGVGEDVVGTGGQAVGNEEDVDSITPAPIVNGTSSSTTSSSSEISPPPGDDVKPGGGIDAAVPPSSSSSSSEKEKEKEKAKAGKLSMSTSVKRKLGLERGGSAGGGGLVAGGGGGGRVQVKVWTRRTWTLEFVSF
ncbi:hypothetical protein HDV00_012211 [Rhizophlyctis rosea]|nr:hypothetical protein HDV00_012211 [Rhizophlyctis rosea]